MVIFGSIHAMIWKLLCYTESLDTSLYYLALTFLVLSLNIPLTNNTLHLSMPWLSGIRFSFFSLDTLYLTHHHLSKYFHSSSTNINTTSLRLSVHKTPDMGSFITLPVLFLKWRNWRCDDLNNLVIPKLAYCQAWLIPYLFASQSLCL